MSRELGRLTPEEMGLRAEDLSIEAVEKNEPLNLDLAVQQEKSLLEKLRGRAKELSLILTFATAFSILKATETRAEGFAGKGSSSKIESVEKGELEKTQDKVVEAMKAVKENLHDANLRSTAQRFIKEWFFEYSVTEETAENVIQDAEVA